jgi:hypothetical protein
MLKELSALTSIEITAISCSEPELRINWPRFHILKKLLTELYAYVTPADQATANTLGYNIIEVKRVPPQPDDGSRIIRSMVVRSHNGSDHSPEDIARSALFLCRLARNSLAHPITRQSETFPVTVMLDTIAVCLGQDDTPETFTARWLKELAKPDLNIKGVIPTSRGSAIGGKPQPRQGLTAQGA